MMFQRPSNALRTWVRTPFQRPSNAFQRPSNALPSTTPIPPTGLRPLLGGCATLKGQQVQRTQKLALAPFHLTARLIRDQEIACQFPLENMEKCEIMQRLGNDLGNNCPMTGAPVATLSAHHRSRITNRSSLLAGVDGRSALARRYRDLVAAFTAEMGGPLGEAEVLQVRAAASMMLHVEELTARIIRGERVDSEEMTRAGNGATRALAALRRRKPAKPRSASVADYLSQRKGHGA